MDVFMPADERILLKHFSLRVVSASCVFTQLRPQTSVKITTHAFFSSDSHRQEEAVTVESNGLRNE